MSGERSLFEENLGACQPKGSFEHGERRWLLVREGAGGEAMWWTIASEDGRLRFTGPVYQEGDYDREAKTVSASLIATCRGIVSQLALA